MTVKEMIEALKQLDEDMEIIYRNEGVWCDCIHPKVEKVDGKEVVVIGK